MSERKTQSLLGKNNRRLSIGLWLLILGLTFESVPAMMATMTSPPSFSIPQAALVAIRFVAPLLLLIGGCMAILSTPLDGTPVVFWIRRFVVSSWSAGLAIQFGLVVAILNQGVASLEMATWWQVGTMFSTLLVVSGQVAAIIHSKRQLHLLGSPLLMWLTVGTLAAAVLMNVLPSILWLLPIGQPSPGFFNSQAAATFTISLIRLLQGSGLSAAICLLTVWLVLRGMLKSRIRPSADHRLEDDVTNPRLVRWAWQLQIGLSVMVATTIGVAFIVVIQILPDSYGKAAGLAILGMCVMACAIAMLTKPHPGDFTSAAHSRWWLAVGTLILALLQLAYNASLDSPFIPPTAQVIVMLAVLAASQHALGHHVGVQRAGLLTAIAAGLLTAAQIVMFFLPAPLPAPDIRVRPGAGLNAIFCITTIALVAQAADCARLLPAWKRYVKQLVDQTASGEKSA